MHHTALILTVLLFTLLHLMKPLNYATIICISALTMQYRQFLVSTHCRIIVFSINNLLIGYQFHNQRYTFLTVNVFFHILLLPTLLTNPFAGALMCCILIATTTHRSQCINSCAKIAFALIGSLVLHSSSDNFWTIRAVWCVFAAYICISSSLSLILPWFCKILEALGHYCIITHSERLSYKTEKLASLLSIQFNSYSDLSFLFTNANAEKLKVEAIVGFDNVQKWNININEKIYILINQWTMSIWPMHYNILIITDTTNDELIKKERVRFEQANIQFSSCAHEIRNPLNSLLLLIKIIKQSIQGGQPILALKNIKTIKFAIQHALLVAKNLLDIGAINHGTFELKIEKVRIQSILHAIYEIYNEQIKEKGIAFLLKHEKIIPEFINTDKMRLTQILINLISNALKFTKSGSITLSVTINSSGYMEFSVADTGIGIKKDFVQFICNAFARAEQSDRSINSQGVGLGLMISKKLASMIGTGLSFDSEEHKGTIFRFTVPISPISLKSGSKNVTE